MLSTSLRIFNIGEYKMSRWLIATEVAYDRSNPNSNKEEVVNKASQEDAYWMMRDKYITREDDDLFYTLLRKCHLQNIVNLLEDKLVNKRDLEVAGFDPNVINRLIEKIKFSDDYNVYKDNELTTLA